MRWLVGLFDLIRTGKAPGYKYDSRGRGVEKTSRKPMKEDEVKGLLYWGRTLWLMALLKKSHVGL